MCKVTLSVGNDNGLVKGKTIIVGKKKKNFRYIKPTSDGIGWDEVLTH